MTNPIEKEILFDVLNNLGDLFHENVLSDFLDEQGVEHDFRKPLHNNLITELKLHHEKYLNIWVNHWVCVNLCTNPTNESKAEQYFCDFYKELGLSKPKKIVWFDNPMKICRQSRDQAISDYVTSQINNQILNQVRCQVNDQMINKIWGQVGKVQWRVYYQVLHYVNSYVNNHVIWDQMWHGQQDANWLAYYAYCMQVLRVEAPKVFLPYMLLAQEVNWWFATKKTVFVVRKPKECIVENGKFVKLVYQDGYTIQ